MMTNEEAIKGLKALRTIHNGNYAPQIDYAIKALEQQQDKVIHNHPCEDCYYNDGDVHAECVVCDKPLEQQPCEYEPFTIAEVSPEMRKLMEEWQQPCDDAVSRQTVLRCIKESREGIDWGQSEDEDAFLHYSAALYRTIASKECLPSVTPKFTDEEIQKMQELEQAQLEKAYELGMQTSFEEWLKSFDTDSATECFTAVQELKKRLEGDDDKN